jgi:hypothetical protein
MRRKEEFVVYLSRSPRNLPGIAHQIFLLLRTALYLSPKRLNDLRILQIGFRERPTPPEARELAR